MTGAVWLLGDWPAPAAAWELAVLAAKATLLVALGAAAAPLVGWRSAAARHLVWAATLAGVLALPVLRVTGPRWTPHTFSTLVSAVEGAATLTPSSEPGPNATRSRPKSELGAHPGSARAPDAVAGSLLMVWGAGVAVGLAAVTRGAAARRRLTRRQFARAPSSGADAAVGDAVRQLGAQLGVYRPVRLFWGPTGVTPMTWGVRRPVVLLPADAADWPAAERDAVLWHELAHVRRGDAGWALVAELACAVFWFHPGVWLARAARLRWQERAADALVVATGAERHAYAAALVHAARLLIRTPGIARRPPTAAPALGIHVGLAERLHVLTAPGFATGPCTRGRRASILAGVAASAVATAALGRAGAMPNQGNAVISAAEQSLPATAAGSTRDVNIRVRQPSGIPTGTGAQLMTGNSSADAESLPFTDDALRLLAEANDEADRLHHEYIGTEHVVLALARRAGPPDVAPLAHLGVDGDRVRQTLATALAVGDSTAARRGRRPYTSRTQAALALAAERARALGHPRVGTAHVLAGVVREGHGIGAQVLQHHGLTVEAADAHVRRLGDGGSPP